MTKEEAVKAAAMGVPVVCRDEMSGKQTVYKRISAVIWRYATIDKVLDEKSISLELLRGDNSRGADIKSLDLVEIANPQLWEQQREVDLEPEKQEKPKAKREKFRKPTVEEVAAYATENLLNVDARAFVDHYESCGWVVGRNKPMKSWQAAVRQWDRRKWEFSSGKEAEQQRESSFETDAFFEAALAKSYRED